MHPSLSTSYVRNYSNYKLLTNIHVYIYTFADILMTYKFIYMYDY